MKSIKDIYKIGTGPSSSHTMGPEKAAKLSLLENSDADSFKVVLYGSLSKTGKGHGTDRAVINALQPKQCEVIFSDSKEAIKHPNTMDIIAYKGEKELNKTRYYSIGGGDIRIEGQAINEHDEEVYLENSFAEIKQFCQLYRRTKRVPISSDSQ